MRLLIILLFVGGFFMSQKINNKENQIFEESLSQDSLTKLNGTGKYRVISGQFHTGLPIYGGTLLRSELQQYYASTIKFGWQNSKPGNWSKMYGTPIYGFGIYTGNVGDKKIFGSPRGVYSWIKINTSKYWRRNVFSISPSVGLMYDLKKYDPLTNPMNDAISSKVSLYFDIEASFSYQLTRELDLVYGIDFLHSSNGRTSVPNFGLNMFGLNLGLTYYYNNEQKNIDRNVYTTDVLPARYHRQPKEKFKIIKENSISALFALGSVQNYTDEDNETQAGKKYLTSSIALDYNYRYNTLFNYTVGLDFFYDSSLVTKYPNKNDWDFYGIHAGADLCFWKMAIRFQAGTYLGSNKNKKILFIRPAIMFDINNWLKLQVGLKTRRGVGADWVEWGVVFVPFHWKKNKK